MQHFTTVNSCISKFCVGLAKNNQFNTLVVLLLSFRVPARLTDKWS